MSFQEDGQLKYKSSFNVKLKPFSSLQLSILPLPVYDMLKITPLGIKILLEFST